MQIQRLRNFILFLFSLFLVAACANNDAYTDSVQENNIPSIDSLVTAEWLSEHLNDPDLVILDTTVQVDFDEKGELKITNGRAGYQAAHIPNAGFADLMGDLADSNSPYLYAIPTPEKFAKAMGVLGVGDDTRVVLYANGYPVWATRVWWMLRWIGFDNVAVLDGGLQAWTDAGHPVSTKAANYSTKTLSVSLRPEIIADRDEVFAAISDDKVSIIDATPEAHFRGDMVLYDRPGHIPTAINIPNVTGEKGKYLDLDELDLMHDASRNARAITYCGGGISASSNAFVMHRLGFKDIAVYMGSLQEWAPDEKNPMTTDVNE